MGKYKITKNELLLAGFVLLAGFIFSARKWIMFLNGLSAFQGFLVYYAILFAVMLFLSKLGFAIVHHNIKSVSQVIGIVLIIFSFFVIFNWESPYVNIVTKGSAENVSIVYFQAEDGVTWSFWNDTMGIKDVETLRILTFMVTPTVLTLLGSLLVSKPKINLL